MTEKVDILFVTDASGSMRPLADAVRNGFNDYIAELRTQANKDINYSVSLTLFNSEADRPLRWDSLDAVRRMDEQMYSPGGVTALLDAVGGTIEGYKGTADKVMLIIQTDGHENSSRQYTYDKVKELLDTKEQEGWLIIYLGQGGDDVIRQADKMGLRRAQTVSYQHSAAGTQSGYIGVAAATVTYANTPKWEASSRVTRDRITADTRKIVEENQGEQTT